MQKQFLAGAALCGATFLAGCGGGSGNDGGAMPVVSTSGQRAQVSIKQTILPDGAVRYSIPVSVGGSAPFDAFLDTGSWGLSLLPGAAPSSAYTNSAVADTVSFVNGVQLTGTRASAKVSVGAATSDVAIPITAVSNASCVAAVANCPASQIPFSIFGIGGDGIPGQGFKAIIGVSLAFVTTTSGQGEPNPLSYFGQGKFIVSLPGAGGDAGTLILNPSTADLAGFTLFQLPALGSTTLPNGLPAWRAGALPACINDQTTQVSYCGNTLLDSGTSNVVIDSPLASAPGQLNAGDQAIFSTSAPQALASPTFAVASSTPARINIAPASATSINAGVLPFRYFDVFYDVKDGVIGLRPKG
jgi:hypothetical protein